MDLLQSAATHLSGCRAVWTTPAPGETGAPARRIVHSREVRLAAPATLTRLGLRLSRAFMKCGNTAELERDWISAARVLVRDGDSDDWQVALTVADIPQPAADAVQWFDLGGRRATAVLLELRQSGIDDWWPGWDVAMGGAILEGELGSAPPPPANTELQVSACDLASLPRGVRAERLAKEVRFRTRWLEVGIDLRRAAFTYLAWDSDGTGRTQRNLAKMGLAEGVPPTLAEYLTQGVRLHPVGGAPVAAFGVHVATGTVTIHGGTVVYDMQMGDTGQHYRLEWEVREDRLVLRAERTGERPLRAWASGAWHVAFDSRVIPVATLGRITRAGETGLMELLVRVHAPGIGTLHIAASGADCLWRSDSVRPYCSATTGELKLGEAAQPEGDYQLLAGRHQAEVVFAVEPMPLVLGNSQVPSEVARAVRRHRLSALTYRADTATLSNNSNGVHSYFCLETWAAIATRSGEIVQGLTGLDLLRDTLEHWLDGAPAYGSGRSSLHDHRYEDEYLQVGPTGLLGVAGYLSTSGDAAWAAQYRAEIARELTRLRARDLDGDGLIESPHRRGITGEHQWSTNWYDVLSFGWKCAFSNAYLYAALRQLGAALPAVGLADLSEGLAEWADRLRANYTPAFYNPATGWLAAWRCQADQLHDFAFPTINGLAVTVGLIDDAPAEALMRRLWAEMARVGFHDFRLGVPTTLWPVPDAEAATYQAGRAFGDYMNGGANHAQASYFVSALYRVGLTAEGDRVLSGLCSSLADDTAFGGVDGTGIDWRRWDGTPSGYEGLLTDQFGILATAIDRYGLAGAA